MPAAKHDTPEANSPIQVRVNYPNTLDRRMARKDGRRDLGGDIMIHGKRSSAGCLSMGDQAAEELFVLAAMVGKPNVKLIISPTDSRNTKPAMSIAAGQPAWSKTLYNKIAIELAAFPKAPKKQLWSFFAQ